MLRGRVRGFFRILALVKPPGVAQTILLSTVSDELPHATGSRARKCCGLESTLRLRQINEGLRHPFLAEHSRDHAAITAGAPQAGFDNGTPAWGLKEIQEGQHFIVHG